MNVFGVGPAELIVILVVALVVVGPERLPRLAADVARMIRDVRRYTGGLAAEFNQVVKDLEQETQADVAEWKEIGEGLSDAAKGVSTELTAARSEATAALTPPPAANPDPVGSLSPPANGMAGAGTVQVSQPAEKLR
jgi:sec-independent protein translocase protein TatB